jgi:hypothetical protein
MNLHPVRSELLDLLDDRITTQYVGTVIDGVAICLGVGRTRDDVEGGADPRAPRLELEGASSRIFSFLHRVLTGFGLHAVHRDDGHGAGLSSPP